MTGSNNKHEAELTACAVAAGATVVHPIAEMPDQGRSGRFDDPFDDRSSACPDRIASRRSPQGMALH
jgi:hypothetical protein